MEKVMSNSLEDLAGVLNGEFSVDFADEGEMLKRVAQSVKDGDELFVFSAYEPESNLEFDFLGCRGGLTSDLKWLFVVDARQKPVSLKC